MTGPELPQALHPNVPIHQMQEALKMHRLESKLPYRTYPGHIPSSMDRLVLASVSLSGLRPHDVAENLGVSSSTARNSLNFVYKSIGLTQAQPLFTDAVHEPTVNCVGRAIIAAHCSSWLTDIYTYNTQLLSGGNKFQIRAAEQIAHWQLTTREWLHDPMHDAAQQELGNRIAALSTRPAKILTALLLGYASANEIVEYYGISKTGNLAKERTIKNQVYTVANTLFPDSAFTSRAKILASSYLYGVGAAAEFVPGGTRQALLASQP